MTGRTESHTDGKGSTKIYLKAIKDSPLRQKIRERAKLLNKGHNREYYLGRKNFLGGPKNN
jgi:hypothetical protein